MAAHTENKFPHLISIQFTSHCSLFLFLFLCRFVCALCVFCWSELACLVCLWPQKCLSYEKKHSWYRVGYLLGLEQLNIFPLVTPSCWRAPVCVFSASACCYLEPASGTPQSTRRSHSSQTPARGTGWDTFPRPPVRAGRREESGSHSDTDLRPGRPASSPGKTKTKQTNNTAAVKNHVGVWGVGMYSAWFRKVPPSPCTGPHICPRTCFGWPCWTEEPELRCPAGGNTLWKWHCRLRKNNPKCYSPRGINKKNNNTAVLWLLSSASIGSASVHWSLWRDPTGTLQGFGLPADAANGSSTSLLCVDDLLTSGQMERL